MTRLVLASRSPARLATLRAAGVEPEVVVSGVDESVVSDPDPASYAGELARLKALAVADRLGTAARADAWVLGCDSVLALDGEILGKPDDAAEATRRWHRMRGRTGVLHTGHCLVGPDGPCCAARSPRRSTSPRSPTPRSRRTSRPASRSQVAGAFTVDGLGGAFVTGIEGDHHNVVGLSLPVLREMLASVGVPWFSLWRDLY